MQDRGVKACHFCKRQFTKTDHLKRHLRTHVRSQLSIDLVNAVQRVCRPTKGLTTAQGACTKIFSRADTLRRHLRTHKGLDTKSDPVRPPRVGSSRDLQDQMQDGNGQDSNLRDPASQWPGSWMQHGDQLLSEPLLLNPMPTAPVIPPNETNGLKAFATLALDLDVTGERQQISGTSHHVSPAASALEPNLGFNWDSASQAIFGTELLDSLPQQMAPFGYEDLEWPTDLVTDEIAGALRLGIAAEPPASTPMTSYFDWLTSEHRHAFEGICDVWPSVVDVRPNAETFDFSSGPASPNGPKSSGQILEPLEPRSPGFLEAAGAAFFRATDSSRNVLHRPTFDYRRRAPLLRLAICASGAKLMHTYEGDAFASKVYDRMSLLLHQYWNDTSKFQFDYIICALLTQKYLMSSGRPHQLSRAFALAGQIMASCRRCGLFMRNNLTTFAPDPRSLDVDDPVALDVTWRKWAASQSVARLVGAVLHMETVISGLFPGDQVPPSIPLASLHLSVSTLHPDAYDASDATSWAAIYQGNQPPQMIALQQLVVAFYSRDASSLPVVKPLDGWALLAVLDVIRGHGRSRSFARLPTTLGPKNPDLETLEALECCRTRVLSISRDLSPPWLWSVIENRWHGTSAFCSIDNELIQVASGRDGPTRAKEAFKQLGSEWVHTPLTRRAVVHAGQIWRNFPQFPDDEMSPFPEFESLPFKGVLVLLAYSLMLGDHVDETRPVINLTDEIDFADVGMVGISTSSLTPMELASSKPAVRFIVQGGPCRIRDHPPLHTVAGRIALVDFCRGIHARAGGAPFTAIGQAYASILATWHDLLRFSVPHMPN